MCKIRRKREQEKSSLPTTITLKIELYYKEQTAERQCDKDEGTEAKGRDVVMDEVNVHLFAQYAKIFTSRFISK